MESPAALRLASWNVNSFRSHEGQVLDWLEANEVDVIGLQETMVSDAEFPRKGLASIGYEVATNGKPGRAGVALASRLPIADVRGAVEGVVAPFDQPRLISATIAGMRVHVGYAPNGRKVGTDEHRFKLAWLQYLGAVIAADGDAVRDHSGSEVRGNGPEAEGTEVSGEKGSQRALGRPTVVLADLNVAPTDLDVWDPHHYRKRNLTSAVEREAFGSLLQVGLVDLVRQQLGADQTGFTWWNRRGDFYESDRGWRLDHLLATPGLAAEAKMLVIDRPERAKPGGSDHAPLRIDLTPPSR